MCELFFFSTFLLDVGGSLKSTSGMVRRPKTQSIINTIKIASNLIAHHPDCNDVKGTRIRADLKKLEQVKVRFDLDRWKEKMTWQKVLENGEESSGRLPLVLHFIDCKRKRSMG